MVLPWMLVLFQLLRSFASASAQGVMGTPGTAALSKTNGEAQGWISVSLAVWEALEAPWSSGTPLSHGTWGMALHALPLGQGEVTGPWSGQNRGGWGSSLQCSSSAGAGLRYLLLCAPDSPLCPPVPGCPLQGRSELLKEPMCCFPPCCSSEFIHSLFSPL